MLVLVHRRSRSWWLTRRKTTERAAHTWQKHERCRTRCRKYAGAGRKLEPFCVYVCPFNQRHHEDEDVFGWKTPLFLAGFNLAKTHYSGPEVHTRLIEFILGNLSCESYFLGGQALLMMPNETLSGKNITLFPRLKIDLSRAHCSPKIHFNPWESKHQAGRASGKHVENVPHKSRPKFTTKFREPGTEKKRSSEPSEAKIPTVNKKQTKQTHSSQNRELPRKIR